MSRLVSIVMPAHNAVVYITDSIRSIQAQTYPHWELIIIDDASLDGTYEMAKKYEARDPRIKPLQLPTNQGAGFARNVGIKYARGEYLAFLDADDLWLPHKLQIQLSFMQQHELQISYSSYELIDEKGKSMNRLVRALDSLSPEKLLKANYIGNLTAMYHAKSLGKIYCPPIRKRQDWAMWMEAIRKAGSAKGISQVLALYRVRKNSLSDNNRDMLKYNYAIYRKVLGFSTLKSIRYFSIFLYEHFFVKTKQTETISNK